MKQRLRRREKKHVKNVGQQLVEELQYILGPNLKKHKDLFINCVEYIFEKWREKLFYKKLPFEEGHDVWVASPAGKVSMVSTNADFPPRVAEKIGRKKKCRTHRCKSRESQIHQRIGALLGRVQESS